MNKLINFIINLSLDINFEIKFLLIIIYEIYKSKS